MKKTTKISLMSGLVTAGVLLCGVHIANAQTNIDSGYTVLIPSEVTIDKESGKGSFSVSGKMDAQTELDVTTTSQNNYKLKCGSQFVDYTLDKQSFHVDNIKSSDVKSFNENFNVSMNHVDMNYSGNYIDRLTFNIKSNAYSYELDLNSVLDGVNNYSVHDYGTADVYINGKKVADDVSDWGGTVHYGDIYEINDIKSTTGHHYSGIADGWNNMKGFPLKGKIGIDTKHVENSKGILYSSVFLKFDTNTYTVKYDSNGGNGSMADTVHKYYKSDKMDGVIKLRKNTFTKTGYKFQGWYLTRVINKEIYYLYDNWQWYKEGVQPSGTKKCLYEDERRTSNATTVDKDVITAVAQWSPITYTIKYDGNGADSGVMENTTHIYHASSAESGVVHLRKNTFKKSGYSFSGWVFSKKINGETYYLYNNGQYNNLQWYKDNEQPAGVEKYIYNDSEGTCNATTIDGDTITAIAQWKKQYTLSFDANGGTVSETTRTVLEGSQVGSLPTPTKEGYRFYGWYAISNNSDWQTSYLIWSDHTLKQDLKVVASWGPPVETLAKQNESTLPDGVYKIFSAMSSFSDYCFKPYSENSGDGNQISLKKEDDSEYDVWQVEHDSNGFVMFKNKKTDKYLDLSSAFASSKSKIQLYNGNDSYAQKWIVVKKNSKYKIVSAVNPNFVLDLSNATLDGGDYGIIQLYYDNGTAAQLWNFKQIYDSKTYSAGTVLNIEGTEYTIIEQKENSKALLVANKSPYSLNYQAGPRSDGKNWNTYEGSQIDNYLENEWYGNLSSKMKGAIQSTDIKQSSYSKEKDTSSKQEVGPNGQVYNTISRHVFIPSISEIEKIVNLENTDKLAQFLNNENIWTRDSCQNDGFGAMYLNKYYGMIRYDVMHDRMARPAFVIDLSKIDYTVAGTINYK